MASSGKIPKLYLSDIYQAFLDANIVSWIENPTKKLLRVAPKPWSVKSTSGGAKHVRNKSEKLRKAYSEMPIEEKASNKKKEK